MPASIMVKIGKDGKISLDVMGVSDASCADLTKALENALGTVEEIKPKEQYFVELDGEKVQVFEE